MNLYEIDAAISEGIEVDEDTGEILNIEWLDGLIMEKNRKIDNIACWIKNDRSVVEALKAEIKNLQARMKTKQNHADSLQRYLEGFLHGEKFESARSAIGWRRSEQVVIAEGTKLPDEYLRYKDPEADKTAIKKALKLGIDIPGASLETHLNMQLK